MPNTSLQNKKGITANASSPELKFCGALPKWFTWFTARWFSWILQNGLAGSSNFFSVWHELERAMAAQGQMKSNGFKQGDKPELDHQRNEDVSRDMVAQPKS